MIRNISGYIPKIAVEFESFGNSIAIAPEAKSAKGVKRSLQKLLYENSKNSKIKTLMITGDIAEGNFLYEYAGSQKALNFLKRYASDTVYYNGLAEQAKISDSYAEEISKRTGSKISPEKFKRMKAAANIARRSSKEIMGEYSTWSNERLYQAREDKLLNLKCWTTCHTKEERGKLSIMFDELKLMMNDQEDLVNREIENDVVLCNKKADEDIDEMLDSLNKITNELKRRGLDPLDNKFSRIHELTMKKKARHDRKYTK